MPATWTDASKVYVNFFAKSDGALNSEIQLTAAPEGLGQAFRKQVQWTGWKLISYRLDGYEYVQPQKITGFIVGVGSAPNKGKNATIKFDFMIITYGKPFYVEPNSF